MHPGWIGLALAAVSGWAFAASPPAVASEAAGGLWGAIAVGNSQVGVAENQPSRQDAERVAVERCQADAGPEADCRRWLKAWRDGCGALVWGYESFGIGVGASVDEATEAGHYECRRSTDQCELHLVTCSLPSAERTP